MERSYKVHIWEEQYKVNFIQINISKFIHFNFEINFIISIASLMIINIIY